MSPFTNCCSKIALQPSISPLPLINASSELDNFYIRCWGNFKGREFMLKYDMNPWKGLQPLWPWHNLSKYISNMSKIWKAHVKCWPLQFLQECRPHIVLTLSKPVLRVQSYQREFKPNCHKRSCTADKNLFTGGWLFIWRLALKSRASEGKNNWWDGWSNIGLKIQEFQGWVTDMSINHVRPCCTNNPYVLHNPT